MLRFCNVGEMGSLFSPEHITHDSSSDRKITARAATLFIRFSISTEQQILGRSREISQCEFQEHSNNQDGDTDGDVLEVIPRKMLESNHPYLPEGCDKECEEYWPIGASPVPLHQPGSKQEHR